MANTNPNQPPVSPQPKPESLVKPVPESKEPKEKKKHHVAGYFISFLIGLILGSATGYFLNNYLVLMPLNEEFQKALNGFNEFQSSIDERISVMENRFDDFLSQSVEEQETEDKDEPKEEVKDEEETVSEEEETSGTGTAPMVGGISPAAITEDWKIYKNEKLHFSFKYPADYEVRRITASEDDKAYKDALFTVGVFKPGETAPAGAVRLFKTSEADGPDHTDIVYDLWHHILPTTVKSIPYGYGGSQIEVTETEVTHNGTEGIQLDVVEGKMKEATEGGNEYTGYLFENQYNATYLVDYCNTDPSSQRALVGCAFVTTFKFVR